VRKGGKCERRRQKNKLKRSKMVEFCGDGGKGDEICVRSKFLPFVVEENFV
jgi:hypothetical protein